MSQRNKQEPRRDAWGMADEDYVALDDALSAMARWWRVLVNVGATMGVSERQLSLVRGVMAKAHDGPEENPEEPDAAE